jgi:hypothetical protein
MSPDLKEVFALVEARTGYPVSVTPLAGQLNHVSMRSATREAPVHAIFPNPQYERFANYLVATQCAILLFKWADPQGVSDFIANDETVDVLREKITRDYRGRGFDVAAAMQHADRLVTGLLMQLASTPLEILSIDWCFQKFPALRGEQEVYVNAHLRELSATLAPKVRKMVPEEVYTPTVTMNAAYTLGWTNVSGDATGLLPYEALGFARIGLDLLNDLKNIPADAADVYQRSVDAWAARLNLKEFYHWSLRRI